MTLLESRNDQIDIGLSSVRVMEAQERSFIYIRNTSIGGQTITLVLNNFQPAVANKGIVLSPGQSFVETNAFDFKAWQGQIQAISDLAGAKLTVSER